MALHSIPASAQIGVAQVALPVAGVACVLRPDAHDLSTNTASTGVAPAVLYPVALLVYLPAGPPRCD